MEEKKETVKGRFDIFFVLAFSGTVIGVLAGLSAMTAGFGSRLGLWNFRTGFDILRFSAYGGIVAIPLAAAGVVFGGKRRLKRLAVALPGVAVGVAVLFVIGNMWIKARTLPPIHDITTDISNPPQFAALLPLRAEATNSAVYGGAEVAIKQLQAYPDIKPLILNAPADQAYDEALATARRMGWDIVSDDKKDLRIEATDTTFWFGFTDDIAIRVTPAGQRSIIDIRSESRVGRSDLGKNADRIRDFLARLRGNA